MKQVISPEATPRKPPSGARVFATPRTAYSCERGRNRVETVFSGLRVTLAGGVHTVTACRFGMKVALAVIAYGITA